MSRIKVGYFIDTDSFGGAEQVLTDIAQYVSETAPEFSPVILHFNNRWLLAQCEKYGLEQLVVPYVKNYKNTLRLPLFAIEFGNWLRRNEIGLLHSHLFGPVTGGALAALVARIPHVGTLHDVYMIEEKPSRILLIKLSSLLRTKLVTVSKDMEAFYRNKASLTDERITTIYNGIDIPDSSPEAVSPGGPLSLICVGRLVALKNVDLVIQAAIDLASDYDIELLIVGDGPERHALEAQVSEKHKQKVRFIGASNDVLSWLQCADIFVQFSNTEGLSRSIIEATAAGLPAVVSDVGGNREIIEDQRNGLVVSSGDLDSLKEAIVKLINDKSLRRSMGEKGRERAKELFSRAASNDQYVQLYRRQLSMDKIS